MSVSVFPVSFAASQGAFNASPRFSGTGCGNDKYKDKSTFELQDQAQSSKRGRNHWNVLTGLGAFGALGNSLAMLDGVDWTEPAFAVTGLLSALLSRDLAKGHATELGNVYEELACREGRPQGDVNGTEDDAPPPN